MQVYLVRHGEAVEEQDDPEQPLNPKGIADVDRFARYLRDYLDLKVADFYHSPKKRAMQTAAIIKNTIYPTASLHAKPCLEPNGSVEEAVKAINGVAGNLMIVGHLPFLNHLAGKLVTKDENNLLLKIPTCSMVILDRDDDRWFISGMLHCGHIAEK